MAFARRFGTPNIHGDPSIEVDRMRRREISMTPRWLERQNRAALAAVAESEPIPKKAQRRELSRLEEANLSRKSTHDEAATTSQCIRPWPLAPAANGMEGLTGTRTPVAQRPPYQQDTPTITPYSRGHRCGLEDRKWNLESIIGKKDDAHGLQYCVEWEDCVLPKLHVRTRANGKMYICCRGRVWPIISATDIPASDLYSEAIVNIRWKNSWNSVADLDGSHGSLGAYNHMLEEAGTATYGGTLGRHGQVQGLEKSFRPRIDADYGPAIRARLLATESRSSFVRNALDALAIRQTTFRDDYIQRHGPIDITRCSKANAMLSHDSGQANLAPCRRCREGRGPFPECVYGGSSVGSCTNCLFEESGDCDHHTTRQRAVAGRLHAAARFQEYSDLDTDSDFEYPTSDSSTASITSTPFTLRGGRLESSVQPPSPFPAATQPTSPLEHEPSSPVPDNGNCLGASKRHPRSSAPSPSLATTLKRQRRADAAPVNDPDASFVVYSSAEPDSDDDSTAARQRKAPRQTHALLSSHEHCVGGIEFCTAYTIASPQSISDPCFPLLPDTVYNDTVFASGEASPAQVHFILNRLICRNADYFELHWRRRVEYCLHTGQDLPVSKAVFVSRVLWQALNRAVEYAPQRPGRVARRSGSSAGDAIVVDESE